MKKIWLLLSICLLFSLNCWYYSFTDESVYSDIEYVYITNFDNKTNEYDIEVELRNEIVNQLVGRHLFKIVSERKDAQASIEAIITKIERKAQVYNREEEVDEYMIELFADVKFYNLDENKTIWSTTLKGWATYLPDEDETTAITEARQKLADRILEKLSSG